MRWSQPLVDGRDEDGRLIADRELVVSRGHGAVPFEAVDAALDRVALAVVDCVEYDPTVIYQPWRHDCYHPNTAGDQRLGRSIDLSVFGLPTTH
jgi:hypothetical protein